MPVLGRNDAGFKVVSLKQGASDSFSSGRKLPLDDSGAAAAKRMEKGERRSEMGLEGESGVPSSRAILSPTYLKGKLRYALYKNGVGLFTSAPM